MPTLRVSLGKLGGPQWTSATVAVTDCRADAFRRYDISLPITKQKIKRNQDKVQVTVSASVPVQVAYGALPAAQAARLIIGMK